MTHGIEFTKLSAICLVITARRHAWATRKKLISRTASSGDGPQDDRKTGYGFVLVGDQRGEEPPRFIVFEYSGRQRVTPDGVCRQGVTFDTGGISLETAGDMDHMKWDMSGAGTVFGVMKRWPNWKPKQNIVGLVVACENMPSGKAPNR